MTREVVLVPGLWMPGSAMALLAARLRARGHAVRVFSYRGRASHESNVEALARFARGGAAFVGHSLGGLVILDMLNRHPEVAAEAVVLLGAPVRGCLAGRRLRSAGVGRWMMGACRSLWDERPARWERASPLGVLAGTLPIGLGRVLGPLPGENDGVVLVEETAVDGMSERTLVHEGHSMLIFTAAVATRVDRFLGAGRFA